MTSNQPNKKLNLGPRGYIALISLLIIGAAGLTIALSASLTGLGTVQLSLADVQASRARSLANSCLEDGLERLRLSWNDYSGSLSIGGESCIINVTTGSGSATLVATGTVSRYTQKIQISVDSKLAVINWQDY